jgi:hypothetical protein
MYQFSTERGGITAIGSSYSYQMSASGASSFTWSASGLPDGLSISSSGLISGKLSCDYLYSVAISSQGGIFSYDVSFTAKSGSASVTKTLTLTCRVSYVINYQVGCTGFYCAP